MRIVTRARVARMRKQETQEDAARALEVTARTIARLESGEMNLDAMSLGFVSKAEKYYGLKIDQLVEEAAA